MAVTTRNPWARPKAQASLAVTLALAITANAAPPAANHPIVGLWSFPVPAQPCTETSFFGPDGVVRVTSGAELTESEYTISAEPKSGGFYEYKDKVIKSNGLKDCSGNPTPVGATSHWFVRFAPDRQSFVMCKAANFDACFGPIRRSHGTES